MSNLDDDRDDLDDFDEDDLEDDETEGSGNRRRLILIALVVVVLLCLVGVVGYRMFFQADGQDVASVGEPPTTAAVATEAPAEAATPEATATATQVVPEATEAATAAPVEATSEESPDESDIEEAVEAVDEREEAEEADTAETTQPVATSPRVPAAAEPNVSTSVELVEVTTIDELLENGDFEDGFAETGVGLHWESFRSDAADINFSAESHDPHIFDGAHAQRISVQNAWQPDRYAGIYQTVEVLPNQVYTLTLHGQIRSRYGSVEGSSYGYRVQYAVDPTGGQDWQSIPPAEWVELPWDEQPLGAPNVIYSPYTSQITTTSESLTLFIRTWNKWADPALVEYSLDGLSLVGVVPGEPLLVEVITSTPDEAAGAFTPADSSGPVGESEAMIDQPLPVTGLATGYSIIADGRFWGATVVLILLAIGAIYRGKWG